MGIIQAEELELKQLKDPSVVELLRQTGIKMGIAVFIQHSVLNFKRIWKKQNEAIQGLRKLSSGNQLTFQDVERSTKYGAYGKGYNSEGSASFFDNY
jgi:hypothetical protein